VDTQAERQTDAHHNTPLPYTFGGVKTSKIEHSLMFCATKQCSVVLSVVDVDEASSAGGEVGTYCGKLVPAVAHQLQQLSIVGRVV